MPYIIEIDGHFIGPFTTEADAKARAIQELTVREKGASAELHFVLSPHWIKPGGPYAVPFTIITADGTVHHPYGEHGEMWPDVNLDGL